MKRLTREERRRIQRRSANLKFLIFLLIVLSLGFALGYTVAHAQDCADQSTEQEVPQDILATETPQDAAERPAEDHSSVADLELIGTFTATAYCPCVKCCGIWSEDHPSRGEDYVQKTHAGTIPEEGRTIAARLGCAAGGQRGHHLRPSLHRRRYRRGHQGQPHRYLL